MDTEGSSQKRKGAFLASYVDKLTRLCFLGNRRRVKAHSKKARRNFPIEEDKTLFPYH